MQPNDINANETAISGKQGAELTSKKRIILTGGGSAGHVTPNLALIPKLQQHGFEIHYLGTAGSIEQNLIEKVPGVEFHALRSGKLRRYFSLKNITDPFKVIAGYFDSSAAIKKIKPCVIFSKGGYVSVPVVAAGRRRKIPVVLHESDYTPGLANKIALNFASKVLVTFEDTLKFTKGRGVFTGTPIRSELYNGNRERGLSFLGFSGKKPVLLCIGGSLGAQNINDALREIIPDLTKRFDVVHICGKGKSSSSIEKNDSYRQFEYVRDELPDIFAASDIAVSRAGANSVFELLALGLPPLLIPLPLATSRGDQIQNADYFSRNGYALILRDEELTPKTLQASIDKLFDSRETIQTAMKNAPNSDGTLCIISEILNAESIANLD